MLNQFDGPRCKRLAMRFYWERRMIERGSPDVPAVGLTFDDGPSPLYTPAILRILEEHQVKATFFCIGSEIRRFPDLVKRVADAGHLIGNHTFRHVDLSFASKRKVVQEIFRTSALLERIGLNRPAYFRLPFGHCNSRVLRLVDQMGLINVTWSLDGFDWEMPGVDQIVNRVVERVGNGMIILLHDGGPDRSQTIEALPKIIANLKSRAFAFQRIDQMRVTLGLPR